MDSSYVRASAGLELDIFLAMAKFSYTVNRNEMGVFGSDFLCALTIFIPLE